MTKRILILVLCLCLGLAAGASGAESLEGRVQDFVASVYADYAAQSFAEVFSLMYPSIGDIVSEEDYVNYQSQNFEELKLHLSEIEVGEVSESPRLSGSLRQLLLDDESHRVYGVAISYKANFVRGVRFSQTISKTVYVVVVDSQSEEGILYLLWEPSSMEEEEMPNDSD
ncbi:MAG: hypothetical protein QM451_01125 [Bacillota bacterium]|jgi:hypothetical protein|nr:hypothetical protein [Bacillota bacterium]HHT89386.1 hypothetical protein [Bacillota bacterium]